MKERCFGKFKGQFYDGILANGISELLNCQSSPEFTKTGIVRENDLSECIAQIEKNSTKNQTYFDSRGKYSAMLYGELIKKWLFMLPSPLLQNSVKPLYFNKFAKCTPNELATHLKQIKEPEKSILLYIWDICALVAKHESQNKMDTEKLAYIFAPYLYYCPDKTKFEEIKPKVFKFCQLGIEWRLKESSFA